MKNRNLLKFEDGRLLVRPRGLDRIWCFRREVSAQLLDILEVEVRPKREVKRGIRTLGTDIGFKICGTFQSDGVVNFWNYRSPAPVLQIRLAPGHSFTNLYLSVGDPGLMKKSILEARAAASRD